MNINRSNLKAILLSFFPRRSEKIQRISLKPIQLVLHVLCLLGKRKEKKRKGKKARKKERKEGKEKKEREKEGKKGLVLRVLY